MGKEAWRPMLRRLPAAGVLLLSLAMAPDSRADTATYLSPSIAVGGVYDDNVFLSSADRQSDEILRISPAVEAGYGSEALSIAGYYTFDAERYRHHPELNGNTVRRNAALNLDYLFTQRLTFSLDTNYTSTETPSELDPALSLGLGRVHATYITIAPSLGYAFDELTYGRIGYAHDVETLATAPQTYSDTGTLGLEHHFTARDAGDFNFADTRYNFGPNDVVSSQVATVGWTHFLALTSSFSFAAGPRRTEGVNSLDYSGGLNFILDSGTFSVTYARSQAALIGEFVPADTRSLIAKLDYNYSQSLEFYVAPSLSSDTVAAARATLYRMDVSFNYRLTRVTSLVGSYEYSLQRGLLTGVDSKILNNVVYIGLLFAAPVAGPGAFMQRRGTPFETRWPSPRPVQIAPAPMNNPSTTNTDQQNETLPP
ncbi:MAG TPA: hypothetical protein VH327_01530 [Gammaproteobacteria bacterium]|nr:hypothetical protein [Gammaproteobacteria bacterium]